MMRGRQYNLLLGARRLDPSHPNLGRVVCYRVDLTLSNVESALLVAIERPSADPSKYAELVARLIDRAIAIERARNSDCRPFGGIGSDQSRSRPRAVACVTWRFGWRRQLHNSKAITSVCHVRKQTHIGHAQLYVLHIV